MKKILQHAALAAGLAYLPASLADSLIDGTYYSPGDSDGQGSCTLVISSLPTEHKYGDELFQLESSGDGACEWSAIGMSKSYAITAGLVTNSGTPAFVQLKFPFGPAGGQIELTTFDVDGTLRNSENFSNEAPVILVGE